MRFQRLPKGQSHLTHGSDSYDKHGMRKANRANDRAAIHEQTEPLEEVEIRLATNSKFSLIINTDGYECDD